jgi:hypothetical protein
LIGDVKAEAVCPTFATISAYHPSSAVFLSLSIHADLEIFVMTALSIRLA